MFKTLSLFSSISCPNRSECSLLNCIFSHEKNDEPQANAEAATVPTKFGNDLSSEKDSFNHTAYREESCESTDSSENGGVAVANYLAEDEYTGQGRTKRRKVVDNDGGGSDSSSSSVAGGVSITPSTVTKETTIYKAHNAADPVKRSPDNAPTKKLTQNKTPTASVAGISERVKEKEPEATPPSTSFATGNRQLQIAQAIRQQKESRQTPQSSTGSSAIHSVGTANSRSPGIPGKAITLTPRPLIRAPATPEKRLRLLQLLHGEYIRLYCTNAKDPDIINIAVDEEEKVATEKKAIYPHVMTSRITALKKLKVEGFASQREELTREKSERNDTSVRPTHNTAAANAQRTSSAPAVAAGGSGGFGGLGGGSELSNLENRKRIASIATDAETPASTDTEPPQYKPVNTGLPVQEELNCLLRLLHSHEDLKKYDYTMEPPTDKEVSDSKKGIDMAAGYEECDRCQTRFKVFPGRNPEGKLASGGQCTYHWGRAMFPPRVMPFNSNEPGGNQRKYSCCSQYIGDSLGCVTAEHHVFKVADIKRLAAQWQFVKTPPNPHPSRTIDEYYVPMVEKAYCLDCEMGYTTLGMEIVRLTLTDWPSGERVIDALVRPFGDVMDLNSRFSGVSSKQFSQAKPFLSKYSPRKHSGPQVRDPTKPVGVIFDISQGIDEELQIFSSPKAARDEVFQYLTPDTPLLGHALENDLNVLRIIHDKIIDTSILFPHKKAFPVRNKLSWIVDKFLQYRIQGSEIGHDSAVDARCAGELVRYRIKEKWGPYLASEVGIIRDAKPGTTAEKDVEMKIERVSPEELQAKARLKRQEKQQQRQQLQAQSQFTVADALRRMEESEREKSLNSVDSISVPEQSIFSPDLRIKRESLINPTPLSTPLPPTITPTVDVPLDSSPASSASFASQFALLNKKRTIDSLGEATSGPVPAKNMKPTYATTLKSAGRVQSANLQPQNGIVGGTPKPNDTSASLKEGKRPFLNEDDDDDDDDDDDLAGSGGVKLDMDMETSPDLNKSGHGFVWGVNSH